jgi:ATP-binding cassette subfamily B protein/subfamily B ATP-binding cassette protein MsbA
LVAISLLSGLLNLLSNALLISWPQALLHLRTQLYSCLQALPLRFHDARRSIDLSFGWPTTPAIQTIYNKAFATTFASVITLIGALDHDSDELAADARLDAAVLPPVVWAIRYYSDRIRRGSTTIQERESDLLATAQEGLGSIQIVQAFGRESFEVEQFSRHATRSLEANFRLNMISLKSALVVGTLMALGSAVMYGAGSLLVLQGGLSLGDLLVFVAYLATLYQPIEQLTCIRLGRWKELRPVSALLRYSTGGRRLRTHPAQQRSRQPRGDHLRWSVFAYDGRRRCSRQSISRSPLARQWPLLVVAAQAEHAP